MKNLLIVLCLITTGSFAQPAVSAIKKVSAQDVKMMIDTSSGPMIINFWASWCGPCIREIPYFETGVAETVVPVKLLLVSLDFPANFPQHLQAFVLKNAIKSEVVYLNETNLKYYVPLIDKRWTGEIPASLFIDNAKKYQRFFNMQLTQPRLALELQNLLQ